MRGFAYFFILNLVTKKQTVRQLQSCLHPTNIPDMYIISIISRARALKAIWIECTVISAMTTLIQHVVNKRALSGQRPSIYANDVCDVKKKEISKHFVLLRARRKTKVSPSLCSSLREGQISRMHQRETQSTRCSWRRKITFFFYTESRRKRMRIWFDNWLSKHRSEALIPRIEFGTCIWWLSESFHKIHFFRSTQFPRKIHVSTCRR